MKNGYIAMYANEETEIFAESSYSAQCKAQEHFQKGRRKKVKGHEIIVVLCEKDGEQVTHSTGSI
jgi:hypothetical protein